MANDLLSALRTYLTKVSVGEKSPQEVAAALNQWAKESGEAIKQRIEEEVERKVSRMGFAKQSDLQRLEREVAELKRAGSKSPTTAKAGAKRATKANRNGSGVKKPAKSGAKKKVASL